jgi:hypothetical protein
MEDLKAVSYGHAVSSLGYEVKLGKKDIVWKDGKHTVSWEAEKQKDGRLRIKRKSRDIKHAEGLGDRELGMIDEMVLRAAKVMRINAYFE